MFAFEIHVNGRKVCTAGVDGPGVLTTIISSVSGTKFVKGRETKIDVGGLVSRTNEHVDWFERRLRKRDEITLRIIETPDISPVKDRRAARTPAESLKYEKAHFRRKAKEFGWKILPAKKPAKKS